MRTPVLSKATWSASASRSSPAPDLTSTPRRNRREAAATCTAGTARPRAQGQVTISTVAARITASRTGIPSNHATTKVRAAAVWTTGT